MSSILIENVNIIDPARKTSENGSLLVADGKLFVNPPEATADSTLDARGLSAAPGLVDVYARLREPGQEYKADISSECKAAIHGGITRLICSPDTDPVIDETATVELIHQRTEAAGYAAVYPLAAMTQKLKGKQISELARLTRAGCVAASQADMPLPDTRTMKSIMAYAATFDITLMLVAQDACLATDGVIHEGLAATRMGLIGIPVTAETVALSVLLELAWQTGARLHLSRVTSARGLDLIRQAKSRGLPVTADTSINHLMLCDEDCLDFNSQCHINPPARSLKDRQALREALRDGTLDAICSDHAPHDPDAKLAPYPSTEPGISGLDLFLPLMLKLAREMQMPVPELLAMCSCNPARIFNLGGGSLENGQAADLVLFATGERFTVDTAAFRSRGKNSPYQGQVLQGRAKHVFLEKNHYLL